MLQKFESPVKCELRSVIRFLHAEGRNVVDIHRWMTNKYGKIFMSAEFEVFEFFTCNVIEY